MPSSKSQKTGPRHGHPQVNKPQFAVLKGRVRLEHIASPTQVRQIAMVALDHIKPHPHNTRTHSKKQIRQIADSIRAVGFASPVLVDEHGVLLAGHGRYEAGKLLGLKTIPAIVIDGLTDARKRALLLADNRIALSANWDRERLASELLSLPELLVEDGLDITVTGFEPAEIDALIADRGRHIRPGR